MGLGANIKLFRQGAGLTQEELAVKIGISRSSLANWEVERTEPGVDEINKLANIFDIGVERLIGQPKPKKEEYIVSTKTHMELSYKLAHITNSDDLIFLNGVIDYLIRKQVK